MKICQVILVCILSVCGAEKRTKRQATVLGTEPRPDQSNCVDYRDQPGVCGRLRSCRQWINTFSNNPSRVDIKNLRNSLCGQEFVGGRQVPLICCVSGTPSVINPPTQRPTQRPTQQPTQPPSQGGNPEQHRNRRLLPQDNECGSTIFDRIVGGKEVALGAYPWLVIFGYSVAGTGAIELHCGATLISDRYVLTAAHCVTNLRSNLSLSVIRLGEHDTTTDIDCKVRNGVRDCAEPLQEFAPEEVIPHAQYNRPHQHWNDIALIRLSGRVNKNPYVSPICMPFGVYGTKDYVGDRLWVAGFGLTQAFGEHSEVLMDLRVPVMDNPKCSRIFNRRGATIGENQMCAGGESRRDSCGDDSGGPLMGISQFGPPFRIVGVVSFGLNRCGTTGVPGVYTRIGSYLNWVMDNIRA